MPKKTVLRVVSMLFALIFVFTTVITPVNASDEVAEQADVSPNVAAPGSSSDKPAEAPKKDEVTGAMPSIDFALKSGKTYKFKCSAPADATVTASFNGNTYTLKQTAKKNGIGTYSYEHEIPAVEGIKQLGDVVYTAVTPSKTYTETSEGKLFAVGENATLHVEVKNTSATAYKNAKKKEEGYITTVKKGAQDSVEDFYENMYLLSSSGWVSAEALQPLTTAPILKNEVSSVTFKNTTDGELFTLFGTANPTYKVSQTKNYLKLTFARTSGVPEINTDKSAIVNLAEVTKNENGSTSITFHYKEGVVLWGYHVWYEQGAINIIMRTKPEPSGDLPLSGIVVLVDAGHGGIDTGAVGLAGKTGAVEKDINLATAKQLKEQLEAKGATVVMTRQTDEVVVLSDRLASAVSNKADFVVSIHANSSSNAKASGTEVFYYEPGSYVFATRASKAISSRNNFSNRGSKYSSFVLTLNSYAPSILVEVGFMTNANDYKTMKSNAGAQATAKGITDAILAAFK